MDWIITLPQTVKWSDYQVELESVTDGSKVLNYRLPYQPKAQVGDRCYLVWRGKVRGWMKVVGVEHSDGFTCTTTGTSWRAGWYLQRAGQFFSCDGPEMVGFRGIRKFTGDTF